MYAISRAIIDSQEMMSKIFKIKAMNEFNAERARAICEFKKDELNNILKDLQRIANKSENKLYIYTLLKLSTMIELQKRGFNICEHLSMDMQRDGIFYTISF